MASSGSDSRTVCSSPTARRNSSCSRTRRSIDLLPRDPEPSGEKPFVRKIARREFLKAAPTGLATYVAAASAGIEPAEAQPAVNPTIGAAAYTPVADYPIQPKRCSEVTIT